MNVTVRIFGLKNFPFNKKTINVKNENLIIGDLIKIIDNRYKVNVAEEIIDKEELDSNYVILVNGRSIGSLKKLETKINDGDKVFLTVFTAGG